MSKPIGQASNFTKFYPVIPGTKYIQTCLFAISGNDLKFIYDLLKFYDFQWQATLSEQEYVAFVQEMLNCQRHRCLGDWPLEGHHGV